MNKDPTIEEHVRQSLAACRIFYCLLYAFFYLAVVLYPNQLKSNLLYTFLYYLPVSVIAVTLFIKAGENPGFVDETIETEPVDTELGILPLD
jgi:hypothetical protein